MFAPLMLRDVSLILSCTGQIQDASLILGEIGLQKSHSDQLSLISVWGVPKIRDCDKLATLLYPGYLYSIEGWLVEQDFKVVLHGLTCCFSVDEGAELMFTPEPQSAPHIVTKVSFDGDVLSGAKLTVFRQTNLLESAEVGVK